MRTPLHCGLWSSAAAPALMTAHSDRRSQCARPPSQYRSLAYHIMLAGSRNESLAVQRNWHEYSACEATDTFMHTSTFLHGCELCNEYEMWLCQHVKCNLITANLIPQQSDPTTCTDMPFQACSCQDSRSLAGG